jgi:hypothetical protein
MRKPTWEAVRDVFAVDGGLRDIYVFDTGMDDWQRMLEQLDAAGYQLRSFRDGQPTELPTNAAEEFSDRNECSRMLSVFFDGVQANSHFFSPEEIEFDLDPREIRAQEQLDAIIRFMHFLANTTEKESVLTPENGRANVVFRVRPHDSNVEYAPPG